MNKKYKNRLLKGKNMNNKKYNNRFLKDKNMDNKKYQKKNKILKLHNKERESSLIFNFMRIKIILIYKVGNKSFKIKKRNHPKVSKK